MGEIDYGSRLVDLLGGGGTSLGDTAVGLFERGMATWGPGTQPQEFQFDDMMRHAVRSGSSGDDLEASLTGFGHELSAEQGQTYERVFTASNKRWSPLYNLALQMQESGEGAESEYSAALRAIKPEDRKFFLGIFNDLALESGLERDKYAKVAATLRRGVERFGGGIARFVGEFTPRDLDVGVDLEDFASDVGFMEQVRQARTGADPIKGDTWLGQAAYDALEMTPIMVGAGIAGAANPVLGIAVMGGVESVDALDQMREQGVPDDVAKPAALLTGMIAGAIEYAQFKTIVGAGKAGAQTVAQSVFKKLGSYGYAVTTETVEEFAQEVVTLLGVELVKEQSYEQFMENTQAGLVDAMARMPRTMAALALMTGGPAIMNAQFTQQSAETIRDGLSADGKKTEAAQVQQAILGKIEGTLTTEEMSDQVKEVIGAPVVEAVPPEEKARILKAEKGLPEREVDRAAPTVEMEVSRTAPTEQMAVPLEGIIPTEPSAQAAAEEAAARPKGEYEYSFPPVGGKPFKIRESLADPKILEQVPSLQGEPIERIIAAKGVPDPTVFGKIVEAGRSFVRKTRAQEFVPNTPQFASANEGFRLLKEVPQAASDESFRAIASISDSLANPQDMELFELKLLVEDQMQSLLEATPGEAAPLRFGFQTQEHVEQAQSEIDVLVEKSPNVKKAIETRNKVRRELVRSLVDEKMLPEESIENDAYWHRQVLSKMRANTLYQTGGRTKPKRRGFQKARVKGVEQLGQEYDYNTRYIEAESEWMVEARIELGKRAALRRFVTAPYDLKPQLKKEAKAKKTSWQELATKKQGYETWQPEPGNYFYRAITIPEKIAEQIQQSGLEGLELSDTDLRTVLAMGQPHMQFVLPTEIVQQLQSMEKQKPTGALGALSKGAMRAWKQYTLLNPKRAIAYMARNLTGDLDAVIGGAPGVTKFVGTVIPMLREYHGDNIAISQELRDMRDLGVISSSMTAQEIPDVRKMDVFERFYGSDPKLSDIPVAYFDTVKYYNEFRENTLRAASYMYYLDKLNSGTLQHYGGAKKSTVDALAKTQGNKVAAAHLSRNLLGDYGNLSVIGDYLKQQWIPFWSWMEINSIRFPRMVLNAAMVGKGKGAITGAAISGLAMMQIAGFYGAQWTWNNLMFPDEEEELGPYERANPHLTLGRNADGSIRVFRNVGAVGDVLEWLGVNTIMSLYPQYEAGQITAGELWTEVLKDPINKVLQGLRPDLKALIEVPLGKSTFPDIFQPRTIDRGEAVANIFGLKDEYRYLRGVFLGDGSSSRQHYLQRMLWGVTDPRKAALYEIYDLRAKYKKEPHRDHGMSVFRPMREAAMNEDFAAFVDARAQYMKEGKSFKDFLTGLRHLDPIAAKMKRSDELKFEHEFLTSKQRQKLNVARHYAKKLEVLMRLWWRDAAESRTAPRIPVQRSRDILGEFMSR